MVRLADADDDLRVGVRGHVRRFLARERQHDAAAPIAPRRRLVRAVLAGDLEARPLAPQVDARRRFDDVDDECAADARGGLEEVPGAIVRADELRVRHAAQQSERLEDARVQLLERGGVRIARRAASA